MPPINQTVAGNEAKAKQYIQEHPIEVAYDINSPLKNAFDTLKKAATPEQQQMAFENLKSLTFMNAATSAGAVGGSYISADQALNGQLTRQFDTSKEVYLAAAQEYVTKGVLTTQTQNSLSRQTSEDGIKQNELMKNILTEEGYAVFSSMKAYSPEFTLVMKDMLDAFARKDSPTIRESLSNSADKIRAISNLEKVFKSENKVQMSPLQKDLYTQLGSALVDAVSADDKTQIKALETITPEMLVNLPTKYVQQVAARVEAASNDIRNAWMNEARNYGVEPGRSLSEIYKVAVSKDGERVVLVVNPNEVPDKAKAATLSGSIFTAKLTALIKAKKALTGMSTDKAVEEVLNEPVKPSTTPEQKKQDKLSLSEDRMKFIQSLPEEDWQQLMQA